MGKNILEIFLNKLLEFPLWVKQVIYLRLYENLALYLSEDFIQTRAENVFHLYVPVLTFSGKTELAERKCKLGNNVYNFLANADAGLNMLEMSMNNFWTMEELSQYFILCLEQNYLKSPLSVYVTAMAGFMSGKYRTGEFFKRVGKIDVDQLEKTIIKQKEYSQTNSPKKMAEIMIELGYITEKDTTSLLRIKEEAKKRFILDTSIIPKETGESVEDLKYFKEECEKLKDQNKVLKEQLNKILALVKKNNG